MTTRHSPPDSHRRGGQAGTDWSEDHEASVCLTGTRSSGAAPTAVVRVLRRLFPDRRFVLHLAVLAGLIVAVVWPVLAHSDLWARNGGPIFFHVSEGHALHLADVLLVAGIAAASWGGARHLGRASRARRAGS